MDNRPIGVFDSGVGGLTVVKEIMKILPDEDIIYFGDTARVPYGNKSPQTVTKFSFQDTRFLISKNVKAIVIACNTASAMSLENVQKNFELPIVGVIRSGAIAAVNETKSGRIGLIGTEGTICSRAYEKEIKKLYPSGYIFGVPCPLFVPLVEEGWADSEIAYMVATEYLAGFKAKNIDTLIMGCTHYPLLKKVVGSIMGDDVKLINPAKETSIEIKEILNEMDMCNIANRNPVYQYYVSDNPEKFSSIGNNFLNREILNIQKIDIEKY